MVASLCARYARRWSEDIEAIGNLLVAAYTCLLGDGNNRVFESLASGLALLL